MCSCHYALAAGQNLHPHFQLDRRSQDPIQNHLNSRKPWAGHSGLLVQSLHSLVKDPDSRSVGVAALTCWSHPLGGNGCSNFGCHTAPLGSRGGTEMGWFFPEVLLQTLPSLLIIRTRPCALPAPSHWQREEDPWDWLRLIRIYWVY